MNGANFYGYIRCKLGSKKMSSVASNFLGQQVFRSVSATFICSKYYIFADFFAVDFSEFAE